MKSFIGLAGLVLLSGFTACSLPRLLGNKLEGAEYCPKPPDRYRTAPVVMCQPHPDIPGGLCCAYAYQEDTDEEICFHMLCAAECGDFEYIKSLCVPQPGEDKGI